MRCCCCHRCCASRASIRAKHQILDRRADARRDRCRLWRHRHQRAVFDQGGVRLGPRAVHDRQRLRHPVDLLLDAHGHRLDQVRGAGAARRQPRRRRAGRDARAGVAVGQGAAEVAQRAAAGRHLRHLPVLRRRRDHTRDLGAVGGRRARSGVAAVCRLRDPAHGADPVRPVRGAEKGHHRHRSVLRPAHAAVVRRDRRAGGLSHRRASGNPLGAVAASCAALHLAAAVRDLHHPGRGGAVRDRRRSALCGHGPLRQEADPAGLVLGRDAGADPELLRPGRAAAGAAGRGEEPFFS